MTSAPTSPETKNRAPSEKPKSSVATWVLWCILALSIYLSSFVAFVIVGELDIQLPGHHFCYTDYNADNDLLERILYVFYYPAYSLSNLVGIDLVHTELLGGLD